MLVIRRVLNQSILFDNKEIILKSIILDSKNFIGKEAILLITHDDKQKSIRVKKKEKLEVFPDVTIMLNNIGSRAVKFYIDAPKSIKILRKELVESPQYVEAC